jgi:hypothetical protein
MSDPNGKSATNAHHPEAILSKFEQFLASKRAADRPIFCGVVERRSKGYPMPLEAAFGPVRGARSHLGEIQPSGVSYAYSDAGESERTHVEELERGLPAELADDLLIAFVSISETLITSILRGIPRDPRVVSAVRNTVRDHCIDEARHHSYFVYVVHQHWASSTPDRREILGPLYAKLIQLFLA